MLVMIATSGFRRRKLPSLSSASATSHSPLPRRAFAPAASSLSADDEGRIQPAFAQHAGEQRRRRGLAVRAGHGDAAAEAHQLGEHFRARHDRDALRARLDQFGVVGLDRAGHHDAIGADDVRRGVAAMDAGAQRRQPARGRVVGVVGAGHLVAERAQHFGDAAHADAADADEMHARAAPSRRIARHRPWRVAGIASRRRCVCGAAGADAGLTGCEHDVGHALGRIGLRQRARGFGHRAGDAPDRPRSVAQHDAQFVRERVVLRQQHGGAALDQVFGVARLVVVDRQRERHQHAADAGGAQFGQRQRAGAAHDEVGPGIGRRHVGDEGLDARRRCRRSRIRAHRLRRAVSRRTGGAPRCGVRAMPASAFGTAC